MAKINLDKYYTSKELAKHCIDTFWRHCFGITEIMAEFKNGLKLLIYDTLSKVKKLQ